MAAYCPEPRHPIDIRFFVDNKNYLAMNYLEVTIKQDYFTKRVVKVQPSPEGGLAEGFLTTTVPDGNITLVTCALVSCPSKEMELLCGEVRFPAQIAIDKIHEVTYSTDGACEEKTAVPFLAQRLP
jgi:hypothetical protein